MIELTWLEAVGAVAVIVLVVASVTLYIVERRIKRNWPK